MDDLRLYILNELKRSIGRCSDWSRRKRYIDSAPWSYYYFPWLLQPSDDPAEEIVIQKAAQMGFSELALNRALFFLDELRKDVLYLLPSERPDAAAFSRGRIDPAVAQSPQLTNLFTHSRSDSHKQTKDYCNLYIRGTKSRSALKSIPCALVVFDETDEVGEASISLARHRLDGQRGTKGIISLSTPSYQGIGINRLYADTTQSSYFFPCPSCDRHINLTLENLEVCGESITDPDIKRSRIFCTHCGGTINHEDKARIFEHASWVPAYPQRAISGYHINQLYSTTVNAETLALRFIRGQYNISDKIEFYNSSLGETYTPDGSKITDELINECLSDSLSNGTPRTDRKSLVTLGVDIGPAILHISVVEWQVDPQLHKTDLVLASRGRLLLHTHATEIDELDSIIDRYRPRCFVIDAQPEVRLVLKYLKDWKGVGYACYYSNQKVSREINSTDYTITVNRTYWLDASLGKIHSHQLDLPTDLSLDYREQLKALTRVFRRNDEGELSSYYVTTGHSDDHYAHSLNYATIALGNLAGRGPNIDL